MPVLEALSASPISPNDPHLNRRKRKAEHTEQRVRLWLLLHIADEKHDKTGQSDRCDEEAKGDPFRGFALLDNTIHEQHDRHDQQKQNERRNAHVQRSLSCTAPRKDSVFPSVPSWP